MSMINYIEATGGLPESYTSRKVDIPYEVCDKTGYPFPCDLSYEIIEETKEVIAAKVEYHFGGPFDGTEDVVKEYINELESGCEFMCIVEIE